jgi:lipid-A-disaccharide synthase
MKALIVAGEASGDLYGGRLAKILADKISDLSFFGMGGDTMRQAGVHLLFDYRSVTVVGVFEVFRKLRQLRQAHSLIRNWISNERPEFAILIDFPDFNFRIAGLLKKAGIKIIYFISPQVWAWRKNRIQFLKNHVDLMISILPFEQSLYEKAGVNVKYTGHPLVEIVREQLAHELPFPRGDKPLVGIMPGSRDVEVKRHLPLLIDALSRLRTRQPIDSIVIWPPSLDSEKFEIPSWLSIVRENRYSAMKACDLLLVASGTSTLESAILEVPLMIVYRVSWISWQLGKILVKVPYYGLVNWVAQRKCIPEYIQKDMDPEKLAVDAEELLKNESRRIQMKKDLREIVHSLGPEGAMERAALAIVQKIGVAGSLKEFQT